MTKSNRRRLTGASASPRDRGDLEKEETDILSPLPTDAVYFKSSHPAKNNAHRGTGVILFTLKKNQKAERAVYGNALGKFENLNKVRKTKIPHPEVLSGSPTWTRIQPDRRMIQEERDS